MKLENYFGELNITDSKEKKNGYLVSLSTSNNYESISIELTEEEVKLLINSLNSKINNK